MKVAIIGSRTLHISNITEYIPDGCDEIISGGAAGVDRCAAWFANENSLRLTVFSPEYSRFGKAAPIIRNRQIVDHADLVLAFWDGKSKGTLSVINYCHKTGKRCRIIHMNNP